MTIANGYRMQVVRVDTKRLQMGITNHGNKAIIRNITLNDVLHAPESKESLISVPCHTEKGFKVKFDGVDVVIIRQHSVEGTAQRVD